MSTPIRRYKRPRQLAPADAVRNFVYFLLDGHGIPVYIGRSCDVKARIRAHHANATCDYNAEVRERAAWFFDVRSVSMVGPFDWDAAIKRERAEIERHQPCGNRMHTKAHGYYPLAEGGGQSRDRRPISERRSA